MKNGTVLNDDGPPGGRNELLECLPAGHQTPGGNSHDMKRSSVLPKLRPFLFAGELPSRRYLLPGRLPELEHPAAGSVIGPEACTPKIGATTGSVKLSRVRVPSVGMGRRPASALRQEW